MAQMASLPLLGPNTGNSGYVILGMGKGTVGDTITVPQPAKIGSAAADIGVLTCDHTGTDTEDCCIDTLAVSATTGVVTFALRGHAAHTVFWICLGPQ